MILLLMFFSQISAADTGTCGTDESVSYTINGTTITFTKTNPDQTATWDDDCKYQFANNANIKEVIIAGNKSDPANNKINFHKADATGYFKNLTNLEKMDLELLDVSGVTDMHSMFYECSSLETLNLSSWDTSNVTDMYSMFYECSSLETLNLSSWDTSNVTDMHEMFYGCSSLTALDLDNWNVSNAIDFKYMFYGCGNLTALDIGSWNVSKMAYSSSMFNGCSSLTELNIRNWNAPEITLTKRITMFKNCGKLNTITLGENSLKNNNFFFRDSLLQDFLPKYDGPWYYVEKDKSIAIDPDALKEGDTLSGSQLFAHYTPAKMAGTWSTVLKITLSGVEQGRLGDDTYTYDPTSGTYSRTYTTANLPLTLPVSPTKTGSTFGGWYGTDLTEATRVVTITTENLGNKEYTAVWVNGPVIVTQPENLTLTYGTSGSLIIAADTTDVSYQWYSAKSPDSYAEGTPIAGEDSDKYEILSGESVGTKYYYCVVTSAAGTAAFSNIATVTIEPKAVNLGGALNADKAYDGTTTASFDTSGVTFEGKLDGDELGLSLTGTYSDANVGTRNVTITSYQLTGEKAQNYKIFFVPSGWNSLTANITPAGIPEVAITIAEPKGNEELPKTAASSPENIKSCTVSWDSEGIADYNTDYTAAFTVVPDSNHIFDEHTAAKVNGQNVASGDVILNTDGTLTVNYKFHTPPKSGICGTDVKYVIVGDTISYYRNNPDDDRTYWHPISCGKNLLTNEIKNVVVVDKIKVPTNLEDAFAGNTNLVAMDLSNFIMETDGLRNAFSGCSSLKTLKINGLSMSEAVTSLYDTFKDCSSLEELDLSGLDTSNITNMEGTFSGCSSLKTLKLKENWVTDKVNNVMYMFGGCSSLTDSSLTDLHLTSWNTSNVKHMNGIFQGCSQLTDLSVISNWNTSKVEMFDYMFSGCSALETPAVSQWNTSGANSFDYMFSGCSALQSLDLSQWNTSNLRKTVHMFDGCSSLSALDVSRWNTSIVTDMSEMFLNCSSLTELDISGWDTSSVGAYSDAFKGTGIRTLTLGEKSFEQSIYDSPTSPNYSSPWVYIEQGESAVSALPIGTVKVGYDFLNYDGYNYKQMAGTWTANTATVTFNPNEGTGSIYTQTVGVNIATSLKPNEFKRTGYSFAEWNTVQTPTAENPGTSYSNRGTITIAENLALYAQWDPYKYTVSFNANQPDGAPDPVAGEMNPQNFTYDVEQQLSKNKFTLKGYDFAGWNTRADGKGTPYTDEQSVKNLTAEDSGNVTLYGQWDPINYTITIITDNNGTVTASPAGTADVPAHYGNKVTLTIDPKEGYVLNTLVIKSSGGETVPYDAETGTFTMPADGVTVTASFKKHVHEYTYSAVDNMLIAKCANTDGGHVGNPAAALTLNGPENLIYDGSAKDAFVTGEIPDVITPSIVYRQDGIDIGGAPVNAGNYTAEITLEGATAKIEFMIVKPTPEIEPPAASAIKDGQPLFDSQLTGGSAMVDGTPVSGSFTWKDPSIRPDPSDSQSTEYEVIFVPDDSVNFNPVVIKLKLTVEEVIRAVVTFTVVNGTWTGGSDDDIKVTLTGGKGEELRLKADQIPMPGEPAAGYRTGSWDAAPSTETVITRDTTYTYSFAPAAYTVTVTSDGNGDVKAVPANVSSKAAGQTKISGPTGMKVKLSAEPDDGYQFKGWQVLAGGVEIGDDNTFTIGTEDVFILALFEKSGGDICQTKISLKTVY